MCCSVHDHVQRIKGLSRTRRSRVWRSNPARFAHWGGGSPHLGARRPRRPSVQCPPIPAVAVSKPDGDARDRVAAAAGVHSRRRLRRRLVQRACSGGRDQGVTTIRAAARPLMTLGRRRRRQATGTPCMLESRAHALGRTGTGSSAAVRIAWWPGHSTGRLRARRYSDTLRRSRPELHRAHELDSPGCRDATDYLFIPWMAENTGFVTRRGARRRGSRGRGQAPDAVVGLFVPFISASPDASRVPRAFEGRDRRARLLLRHGQWRKPRMAHR